MHKNVLLSQASMANAYNLRYFVFRDEEDGFLVSQGPALPTQKKKKGKDMMSKMDHMTRVEHIREIWE
jgi:hypothetical protein